MMKLHFLLVSPMYLIGETAVHNNAAWAMLIEQGVCVKYLSKGALIVANSTDSVTFAWNAAL